MSVLLVEDDSEDVELTLRALGKYNLANRVHVARDGVEALDYLRTAERPHVVLLDLKLPKVTGLEVLRMIREDPRPMTLAGTTARGGRKGHQLSARQ